MPTEISSRLSSRLYLAILGSQREMKSTKWKARRRENIARASPQACWKISGIFHKTSRRSAERGWYNRIWLVVSYCSRDFQKMPISLITADNHSRLIHLLDSSVYANTSRFSRAYTNVISADRTRLCTKRIKSISSTREKIGKEFCLRA